MIYTAFRRFWAQRMYLDRKGVFPEPGDIKIKTSKVAVAVEAILLVAVLYACAKWVVR